MKKYLTRREVAEHYPISPSKLAQLAMKGEGPQFFKPFNRALYKVADLDEWFESRPMIERPELRAHEPGEEKAEAPSEAPNPKTEAARRAPTTGEAKKNGVNKGKKRGRPRKNLVPSANSWLRTNDDQS